MKSLSSLSSNSKSSSLFSSIPSESSTLLTGARFRVLRRGGNGSISGVGSSVVTRARLRAPPVLFAVRFRVACLGIGFSEHFGIDSPTGQANRQFDGRIDGHIVDVSGLGRGMCARNERVLVCHRSAVNASVSREGREESACSSIGLDVTGTTVVLKL